MSSTRRPQRAHTSSRSATRAPQHRTGISATNPTSARTAESPAAAKASGIGAPTKTPTAKSGAYQERPGAAYGQTKATTYQERAATRTSRGPSNQNRRRRGKRSWLQTRWPIVSAVVGVVLIVAIFLVFANRTTGYKATVAPTDIVQETTHVPASVFAAVGASSLKNPFLATPSGTDVLKGPDGKPEFLYMGAEYCPYCAAERWSMVVALSRFGAFSHLSVTKSGAAPEPYPQTNTFTFYGSTYTSQYLDFVPVEMQTNLQDGLGGYTNLQTATKAESAIFTQYDQPPYATQAGGIPFLSLGNQYIEVSAGYLPDVLNGQTWQSIAGALSNPTAPTTVEIVANANYLTAGICLMTHNQPASVCAAAPIPTLEKNYGSGK